MLTRPSSGRSIVRVRPSGANVTGYTRSAVTRGVRVSAPGVVARSVTVMLTSLTSGGAAAAAAAKA